MIAVPLEVVVLNVKRDDGRLLYAFYIQTAGYYPRVVEVVVSSC